MQSQRTAYSLDCLLRMTDLPQKMQKWQELVTQRTAPIWRSIKKLLIRLTRSKRYLQLTQLTVPRLQTQQTEETPHFERTMRKLSMLGSQLRQRSSGLQSIAHWLPRRMRPERQQMPQKLRNEHCCWILMPLRPTNSPIPG